MPKQQLSSDALELFRVLKRGDDVTWDSMRRGFAMLELKLAGMVTEVEQLIANPDNMLWPFAIRAYRFGDDSEVPGPDAELPAVDQLERRILRKLLECHPQTLTQVELESDNCGTRKTVRARVNRLIGAGLLRRPKGVRGGVGLTNPGRVLAKKLNGLTGAQNPH